MRFLCVCRAGSVRSVAMADALKGAHGQDALAAGAKANGPETLAMLCAWADRIVVMQPHYAEALPPEQLHKARSVDVGPDVWGTPRHPDLVAAVSAAADAWARRGFRL